MNVSCLHRFTVAVDPSKLCQIMKPLRFALGTRSVSSGKRAVAELDGAPAGIRLIWTSTGNRCHFNKSTDKLPCVSLLSRLTEKKHATSVVWWICKTLHKQYIVVCLCKSDGKTSFPIVSPYLALNHPSYYQVWSLDWCPMGNSTNWNFIKQSSSENMHLPS